ncbi:MAG: nucleotidyltransferase family protein [Magnetococcales bacterium]|nr:nucleotidyltransferase family protein [Magnetococcales bacterium]NGZ25599.1 nucleotidyltransferase family protein [Magnetococcales bacterium]
MSLDDRCGYKEKEVLPFMQSSQEKLQFLLLEILSTQPVDPGMLQEMDAEGWQTVSKMVQQHRLGPLFFWRIGREQKHVYSLIPEEIRDTLQKSFLSSNFRSLALQKELIEIVRHLNAANIPCIVLKGPYLAWFAYPNPGLRPCRDLDLLVPADKVVHAFDVLLKCGYEKSHAAVDPLMTEDANHLTHLIAKKSKIAIELHYSIYYKHSNHASIPLDQDVDYWSRKVQQTIANVEISYFSPMDALLHLIVHAVYQHNMSNGPLVLSDLAYLLRKEKIDWPAFWALASIGNWERGSHLVLKAVARYYQDVDVDFSESLLKGRVDENIISSFLFLSLRDTKSSANVILHAKEKQLKLARFIVMCLGELFPSRHSISARYNIDINSFALTIGYVRRWTDLFLRYFPNYLLAKKHPQLSHEAEQLFQLRTWLRGDKVRFQDQIVHQESR